MPGGRLPCDLPARCKGHAYLLYAHADRPLCAEAALTVGDAAGLAYTQSGEGIRPAVESALLAARVMLDAQGDYRAARLAPYAKAVRARFGPRGPYPDNPFVARVKAAVVPRLIANPWFASRIVVDRWFTAPPPGGLVLKRRASVRHVRAW